MKHSISLMWITCLVLIVLFTGSYSSGTANENNSDGAEESVMPAQLTDTATETPQTIEDETVPVDGEEAAYSNPDAEIVASSDESETPGEPDEPAETMTGILIEIRGTPEFVEQTEQALVLLREKAPQSYNIVQQYIGIIDQGDHSGMWAYEDTPRYEVGDATAFYSLSWYAGTLVHDATHSELYHVYLAEHGTPVPDEDWTGTEAEMICILKQIDTMKAIGAPQSEIEYLESLNGTHYDIDGDGDFDWDDYNGRNW